MSPALVALACVAPDEAARPGDPRADTGGDTHPTADSGVEALPGHDPGDGVFVDDRVHAFSLSLTDAARAALLADPTSWAPAVFSDGELTLDIAVRLKGYSSFQPLTGKPNLRLAFDRVVPGQRHDGLEALDLVSEAEDPAAMSEALAYRIFRAAGLPASRTGFAELHIDGEAYGLYTVVEKKDDVLLDRVWPDDAEGSLYESSSEFWPCDLDDAGAPRCDCWELDEAGSADSRADLEALCALATDTPDEAWPDAIAAAMDWEQVVHHMAMEMVLDAHDHYAGYIGNVYLYHQAAAEKWSLIPASMNSVFGSTRYVADSCGSSGRTLADFDGGLLARRCWADPACAEGLYAAIADDLDALQASDVLSQLDAWEGMLEPHVQADPRSGYSPADFHAQVGCIRDWLQERPAALAPELPAGCLGSGGTLDVAGWGDLSVNGSCDRDAPDAVGWPVLGLDGARVEVGVAPDGVAVGDELILLVGAGVADDVSEVGRHVFAEVAGVEGTAILLAAAPELPDPGAWRIRVQRVPRYDEVTIRAGGVLTASAWDGQTGGLLALRVDGTLWIEAGGTLSVAGLGYAGGATGASYNVDGWQGEGQLGTGIGGAGSAESYNSSNGAWAANLGGGGCNVSGGGGEHAGGATAGASWDGSAPAPEPGAPYGEADLSRLSLGSGGGGVVNLGAGAGPGGAGGGVLHLEVGTLVAEGAGALSARGGDALGSATGSWTYGAGGGAGGSLWLSADSLSLAEGALDAEGGLGWSAVLRPGGDGGVGRIRVDCDEVNGLACADGAFAGLAVPEPWVGSRGRAGAPGRSGR